MKRLHVAICLIGANSICSQIILIRELVAVFAGNELTMGFVLASWFVWVALGSSIGGMLKEGDEHTMRKRFAILQLFIPLILILQIIFIRWSRIILRLPPMATMGLGPIFWVSFISLAPLCLILGTMFSLGYQWLSLPGLTPARRVGRVYVLEAIGAGAGGALFSFLLIRTMSHFQICLLLGAVNLLSSFLLFVQKPGSSPLLAWVSGGLLLCFLGIIITSPIHNLNLDFLIYTFQWQGFELLACRDTIFGRIALTRMQGEYSFYEHGVLTSTIPDPWREEWSVHLPLLQHQEPKSLLLIGTGIGSLKEAMKHKGLLMIDYVEMDPAALSLAEEYCPQEYTKLLSHPKVHPVYKDARLFIRETDRVYDVIILGLPDPKTAQMNRMYTVEFFDLVSRHLSPEGVAAFSVTSSENYIGPQLGDFLCCLYKTVRFVFPEVLVTPGDTAYFLAAKKRGYMTLNPDTLLERLASRGIEADFFSPWYIPASLNTGRIKALQDTLKDTQRVWTNTDLKPICYLYDLVLWGRYFSPLTGSLMERAKEISGRRIFFLFFLATIVFAVCIMFMGKERGQRLTVGVIVLLGGFVEIVLEFLLVLGFQVFYGYAYLHVGVIVTSFMVGLTMGSALMTHILDRIEHAYAWYCGIQISYLTFPLLIMLLFRDLNMVLWPSFVVELLFSLFALTAGFMGGFQFPLATRLFISSNQHWKGDAGLIYGIDLVGSAFGAILASSHLVPLYGITATLSVLSLLAGTGMILLLANRYNMH